MPPRRLVALALALAALLAVVCGRAAPAALDYEGPVADWADYGRGKDGLAWSPLSQITPRNVTALEIAWQHRSGDVSDGTGDTSRTSFQARPIVPNGTLYYCSGLSKVYALDPETGQERWRFDPQLRNRKLGGPYPLVCRGVSYWKDAAPAGGACDERIFTATIDSELVAIDAATGLACESFGSGGRVDLREGFADAPRWEAYVTSPPLVLADLVVVGGLVQDNLRVDAPSGVIRGFDARTGALRWAFDPVPPGTPPLPPAADGAPRWRPGTPNAWAVFSADPARDLLFVPMGNASPDFYGGVRNGLDHFSSSLVALRGSTGEVAWRFQTVHHDLWDYDNASPPSLVTVTRDGARVPVVLQATKTGMLFVLNRENGQPVLPVEERAVPSSNVPGEQAARTQPFTVATPPLSPHAFTVDQIWATSDADRAACRAAIEGLRNDGIFTPPDTKGTLVMPSPIGG
ncbi:MAG: PQQ-binding-like beta-propeller repeat protein, partial [Myxococcota bacterium]